MHTTLYHNDLAKIVGQKIGKPATKTKRLIICLEEIIASELKSKQRVKLQNFGTFYLIHQDSRHIIQIRTKQRRILIGTTLIKFRPSQKVKKKITASDEEVVLKTIEQQFPKPTKLDISAPPSSAETAIDMPVNDKPLEIPIKIKASNKSSIEISPTELNGKGEQPDNAQKEEYEKVDPEKIKDEIRKRLMAVAKRNRTSDEILFSHHILETSPGGKLFALAFKRVMALGEKTINFYIFEGEDNCQLYFGKPRKKLAKIPSSSATEFLSKHLEIDLFDFPQERFVKLYLNSKMDVGWVVFAHSLPLAEGASLYVKLVRQL